MQVASLTPKRARSESSRILADLKFENQKLLSNPFCQMRPLISLIGLLTAKENAHLGRFQMRQIQWHLKNHWRVPESLEKVILISISLKPTLKMVAPRNKCPPKSVTSSTQPSSSDLRRCLKRRLGCSLK